MQYTLTPEHVHRCAAGLLAECLRLTDYGRTCPARTLLTIVFAACARITSLFAAAAGLRRGPSPETVRKALLANLPKLELLERRLNDALRAATPARLGARQRLAVDLTLIPYHGTHHADEDELYRSQVKSGTTHFHAYATAYLVRHGQRVTAALTFVRQGEGLARVLGRLLRTARAAGVRPRLLLLDRGFYSVGVIRYLQAARYPFLMPVPLRGRKADHPKGPGGTRVFDYWRRGGTARHRLIAPGGRAASVGIVVHCRNRAGRRGKHGRERLVYAYWGWVPPSARQVSELYRTRFGIESSYRQMNQCRARTCTRNPAVRLFLVGVALVLRNVWVWLHWEVLSGKRRGRRVLRLDALPLKGLLLMLLDVAVGAFGVADGPTTERPIRVGLVPDRDNTDIGDY
jgi:putative transposase